MANHHIRRAYLERRRLLLGASARREEMRGSDELMNILEASDGENLGKGMFENEP